MDWSDGSDGTFGRLAVHPRQDWWRDKGQAREDYRHNYCREEVLHQADGKIVPALKIPLMPRRLLVNRSDFESARKIRETFVDRKMEKKVPIHWTWPKKLYGVGQ